MDNCAAALNMDQQTIASNTDDQAATLVKTTMAAIITDYVALEQRACSLDSMLTTINAKQKEEICKRAKVSQRLAILLDMLPGGVIVLDQNGIIVESNKAATQILGILELNGATWNSIITKSCRPKLDDGLEVSLHNGKLVSVATNSLPMELGQIILITDLTKTRELQDKLNQQKKLSALGEMVSSLAHQIKTPLAAALLYITHTANPTIDSDKQHLYANRVKERLLYMDDLLQSMLLYVKGYIAPTSTIKVAALLQELKNTSQDLINSNNMRLLICNTVPDASFNGNKTAFLGALMNLINNSIQASKSNSCIAILVTQKVPQYLDFIVSDHGCGIDPENLSKVWQAFYTTKTTGTGLGLAVVETVANACNGKVWLTSKLGKGTKVAIRVPFDV